MRLLQKREVDVAKARDQAREVNEGRKLASSVDRLRELRTTEAASLEKFRASTIATIHEEISKEESRLEDLKSEVSELEKRRKEAQEPLDKEREEVERFKEEVAKHRNELQVRTNAIDLRVRELDIRESSIRDSDVRVRNALERANKLHDDALSEFGEARAAKEGSAKIMENSVSFRRESMDELQKRDAQAAAAERRQTLRDESQDSREIALNELETRLRDRELLLERNLSRYGSKHRGNTRI